jgi:hypothetical protein
VVAPFVVVMSARALCLPPFRPMRAALRALALAAAATALAFLLASLPGAPSAALGQMILRLALLAALFLPAAAWLLRTDLREALGAAGLGVMARPRPSPDAGQASSGSSKLTSVWPSCTVSPAAHETASTTPSAGAARRKTVFIASSTTST